MKILLVGEFSRLHNSLKEGLLTLGHEVILVNNGDGFKNYPADISIRANFFKSKLGNIPRQIWARIFKYDLATLMIFDIVLENFVTMSTQNHHNFNYFSHCDSESCSCHYPYNSQHHASRQNGGKILNDTQC